MGTRFLLTKESTVPDAVKAIYMKTDVAGTVVTRSIDGHPQRVIRTSLVDALERSGLLSGFVRALRHAWAFRAVTGTSIITLLREEVVDEKEPGGSPGVQVAMAANAAETARGHPWSDGRSDVRILPTGQGVGVMDRIPTVAELVARIMSEAEAALGRLGA